LNDPALEGPQIIKYFYFYKFNEKSLKKTERDAAILELTLEERIITKNIRTLMYEADPLEPQAFCIKNKNNVLEIMKIIEHLMESNKAAKKFATNNYDW